MDMSLIAESLVFSAEICPTGTSSQITLSMIVLAAKEARSIAQTCAEIAGAKSMSSRIQYFFLVRLSDTDPMLPTFHH